MPNTIKIVCLATSQKHGGRCVAGKMLTTAGFGAWIRPVSSRPSAEISFEEREYEDGTEPRLLDIITIPTLGKSAHGHQSENHVIDSRYYWKKTGSSKTSDLETALDSPLKLWSNGNSTYHGCNDRVGVSEVASLTHSLYLIKPEHLTLRIFQPGLAFGNVKRDVRASFQYGNDLYDFKVTDLEVKSKLSASSDKSYEIDQGAYLCVSLAEAHTDGFCYKLVASVFMSGGFNVS